MVEVDMVPLTKNLSGFFCSLVKRDIPESTWKGVNRSILDMIECVYSSERSDSRIQGIYRTIKTNRQAGCRLWGLGEFASMQDAALYNASCGAISYRNSLIRQSGTHPMEIVAASCIAAAEEHGLKWDSVVLGVICGVEIVNRLGMALQKAGLKPSFRNTAICAPIGAAVGVSKTLGLEPNHMANAIALASHFSFGTNQWGKSGTGEDVFQAGFGARNGLLCAVMAGNGAVGADVSLEGDAGLLACYGAQEHAHVLTDGLGDSWSIDCLEYKPIGACLMTQTPAQAITRLVGDCGIGIDDVKDVKIMVCAQALRQPGCDSLEVGNLIQAKMNIRYVVASILAGSRISEIRWAPPYDSDVMDLMRRIRLIEKPEYTMTFPGRVATTIVVSTLEGKILEIEMEDFKSLSADESMELFRKVVDSKNGCGSAEMIAESLKDKSLTSEITRNWI